jgi:hypothetical protein
LGFTSLEDCCDPLYLCNIKHKNKYLPVVLGHFDHARSRAETPNQGQAYLAPYLQESLNHISKFHNNLKNKS